MEPISIKSVKASSYESNIHEPLILNLVLECREELPEDVELEVIYGVYSKSEEFDQVLYSGLIGPIPVGMVVFDIPMDQPDISKIPPDLIFGTTTLLIQLKYKDQVFNKAGFFVNIKYPEIPNSLLEYIGEVGSEDLVNLEEIADNEEHTEESEEEIELQKEELNQEESEEVEEEILEKGEMEEKIKVKTIDLLNVQKIDKDEMIEDIEEMENLEKDKTEEKIKAELEKIKEIDSDKKDVKIKTLNDEDEEAVHSSSYSEIKEELERPVDEEYGEKGEIPEEEKIIVNNILLDKRKIYMTIDEEPVITAFPIFWTEEQKKLAEEVNDEIDEEFQEEMVSSDEYFGEPENIEDIEEDDHNEVEGESNDLDNQPKDEQDIKRKKI